jgi:hypothetical protein
MCAWHHLALAVRAWNGRTRVHAGGFVGMSQAAKKAAEAAKKAAEAAEEVRCLSVMRSGCNVQCRMMIEGCSPDAIRDRARRADPGSTQSSPVSTYPPRVLAHVKRYPWEHSQYPL